MNNFFKLNRILLQILFFFIFTPNISLNAVEKIYKGESLSNYFSGLIALNDNLYKESYNFLNKHIEIIKPKIILLLGSTAMRAIINSEEVISKIRGKWHEININKLKVLAMVSFHPAYLLRQPDQKKFSWIDLKMIREKLKSL